MKLDFEMLSSANRSYLNQAILIYGTQPGRMSSQTETLSASIHPVVNVGTAKAPNMQVMPGSPVTQDSLLNVFGSLADKYLLNTELLPEYVLTFSPIHLAWWSPACKRRVYFRNKELGERSEVVPHPPLLHLVVRGAWYVFALEENKRPTKDTKIYHAPYFNVYDDGKICVGSANIPKMLTTTLIGEWESAFFDSAFTHINGQVKKSTHPRGEYALWKELLDGEYQDYPMQYLADRNLTLQGVMQSVTRLMGGQHG